MSPFEAERIAAKYQGMILDGRALRLSVLHLMT
jgi:hypothetical protein